MKRKLKAGMVGGGRGAFIGAVHRIASEHRRTDRTGLRRLPSDPRSRVLPARTASSPGTLYGDYKRWRRQKRNFLAGERIDFVSVVTPNRTHSRSLALSWKQASTSCATSR